MPILVHHEFTFGEVPCVVRTTPDPLPTATPYVLVNDGHALRPLVDSAGQPVRFIGDGSTVDALVLAMDYLQARFGPRAPARRWDPPIPLEDSRVVLEDLPLRPSDTPLRASHAE
jgi:hypothetical protein